MKKQFFLAAGRMMLFAVTTAGLYLLLICGLIPLYLFTTEKSGHRWKQWIVRHWSRAVLWMIGARVTVKGVPPKPPFVLVSNHLSYVDIVLLFAHVDAIFVAKKEVRSWPLMGRMAGTANTIFIDRENLRDILRVNREIDNAIDQQLGVIVFPEGTSSAGAGVLPFKSALLKVPARRDMAVHYASLSYQTPENVPPAHLAICWWGEMTFPGHLFSLMKIPSFDAILTYGECRVWHADPKLLANELWDKVTDIFEPVVTMKTTIVKENQWNLHLHS